MKLLSFGDGGDLFRPMSHLKQVSPENPSLSDEFVSLLTEHQAILFSFIRSSVGDPATSKDILQEVNIILWKKSETFEMGSNFKAWALKIARFQILGNYRDKKRSKLVFDDELLTQFATEAENVDEDWENQQRLKALDVCLKKLPVKQRDILNHRYNSDSTLKDLAETLDSTTSRLKMVLLRARKSLRDCILAQGDMDVVGKGVSS